MLTALCRGAARYLTEVWEYRYFWASLVKAELQRRYRRSLLGEGWSLVQPVAMTLVLSLVYSQLFGMDLATFAPLLLTGLAFWNFVSQSALQGCGSLVNAEPYIRQQAMPLAVFPLRTVLTVGIHFLISLSLALAFSWAVNGAGQPLALLSLVPTLALLFLFGWSVGLLMGFSHVYFPDTQHLAEVGLQALMFLTPIMYPPVLLRDNGLGFILDYSPLAAFLALVREPLLYGTFPTPDAYVNPLLTVLALVGLAVYAVSRLERRVIFAL
jgi:lipopolysaccharide transport system permease protein